MLTYKEKLKLSKLYEGWRHGNWLFQKFKINRREETQVQVYTIVHLFMSRYAGSGGYGSEGRKHLLHCGCPELPFWQVQLDPGNVAMRQCGNVGTMNFVVWRKSTIRGPKVTCCVEESMQMPLWYPYIAGWCAGGWYEESDMTPPVGVDGTEYW